jgi:hypothetical protein
MEQKYNIIGDTHGRTAWKDLVISDGINIFVGDYFSPYVNMSFEDQLNNFLSIIDYKREHPETILLIGNHDDQHWKNISMRTSRFDFYNWKTIKEVFNEFSDFMQVTYNIENKVLVSHAGLSVAWYVNQLLNTSTNILYKLNKEEDCNTIEEAVESFKKEAITVLPEIELVDGTIFEWKNNFYFIEDGKPYIVNTDLDKISTFINKLWNKETVKCFNFSENATTFSDTYGTSPTHGPMWIRPSTLEEYNIFKGKELFQVVGHTMVKKVSQIDNIFYVDCLQYSKESLIVTINDKEMTFQRNNGEEKVN